MFRHDFLLPGTDSIIQTWVAKRVRLVGKLQCLTAVLGIYVLVQTAGNFVSQIWFLTNRLSTLSFASNQIGFVAFRHHRSLLTYLHLVTVVMTSALVCVLVSSLIMRKYNEWKNADTSSRYSKLSSQVAVLNFTAPDRLDRTNWRTLQCSISPILAVIPGFTVQREFWGRKKSTDCCLTWDIWWWQVVCKFSNAPRNICQDLWLSSTGEQDGVWCGMMWWNDAKNTVIPSLSEQSIRTEDASV